ncbi:hypothetical protein ACFSHQ_09405 [Gemmobacter lanyuensis]
MHISNRPFDSITLGETAELRRLITTDDLLVYAAASGNYNPMHLPIADVDGDGQRERAAPGMFVASMISGCWAPNCPAPEHACCISGWTIPPARRRG